MSANKILNLPDLGEVEDVEVIEISAKTGDKVSKEDTIVTLESDKAAMEIPSDYDGEVVKVLVSIGDKVKTGDPFVELLTKKEEASSLNKIQKSSKNKPNKKQISKKIVNLPDLGEVEDIEVIEICVKNGQEVGPDESIIILESDKAAMEVPLNQPGKILKVLVSVGDKVNTGMPFCEIEEEISESIKQASGKPNKDKLKEENNITREQKLPTKIEKTYENFNNKNIHAGPATRKLAREFGIDLGQVKPSGPKRRILKEDLHLFVKSRLNDNEIKGFVHSQPDIDYSVWGKVSELPLTKFQRTAADNLHTSWINIPHVTQHEECDITELLKLRSTLNNKHKLKISPLAYLVKVITNTIKDYELMNSSLSSDLLKIIKKDFINIGIAVDTPNGLIVPNIKNTDQKSIREISTEIFELASLAKTRKLKPDNLKGTTFTISSLSGIGGKFFTPIINPPEVAIIGFSKTFSALKYIDDNIKERSILPISLSYDHRVINGAYAAKFVTAFSEQVEDTNFLKKSF